MQTVGFDPNQLSFDDGIRRINQAVRELAFPKNEIVTSRDPVAERAREVLAVANVPGGFVKWQLPVWLEKASQLFITVAEPDIEVPEHSHDEGDGIRFIASGSILFRDRVLAPGDWMFVPAGVRYRFKVGPTGAVMCYCYCCCCAGRVDLSDEISNPSPMLGA